MSLKKVLFLLSLGALGLALPVLSQTPDATRPSFEVASIKPNNSSEMRRLIMNAPGGRFVATGVSLQVLMTNAYRVRDFQIIGGPDWIRSDRWDVEARAEEGTVPPRTGRMDPTVPDPIALRVQSLLEDRFQLKLHRETRELPVYELTVTKGGSKVKLSEDQGPIRVPEPGTTPLPQLKPGGPMPRGMIRMGRGELEGNGMEFATFVYILSQQLGRSIIDKTGLKGLCDIKLTWTPEMGQGATPFGPLPAVVDPPPASDPSGPSIFTAVQEQLGLKLEPAKGPVEVLVIDSVQKPTEN